MSTKIYPHTKIMADNALVLDSDIISPSTRRSITKFDESLVNFDTIKDATQKNMAGKKLDTASDKIVEMLTGDLEKAATDKAEKEKADKAKADKEAADKEKADKAKAEKEKSEKEKAEAEAKKKAESKVDDKDDEATKKAKAAADAAAAKKANPYDLSEAAMEAKKAFDKIWTEKSKNGTMDITESELSAAGINPWKYLSWTTGKLGPYNFKASVMSDTWTVTKDKKEEPAAA